MRRSCRWPALPAALLLLHAAAVGQTLATQRIASGFNRPVYAGAPRSDPARLFVIEQWEARILIVKNGAIQPVPFLDLPPSKVANFIGEGGLLGMAFHPDYETNGYFFLNYNDPAGETVIARYQRLTPDVADPNSERILRMTPGVTTYSFDQPFDNHNGGWLDFGPDGYLYIANGDGGSGGDPFGNGQNLDSLLGKILRVDVNNPAPPYYSSPSSNPFFGPTPGRDEVWAYGLRNPWRCSFDRLTGELYIGDVGQGVREEISWGPAAGQPNAAGRNYGWNCFEGFANYSSCTLPNHVPPIYDYTHGVPPINGYCVIGGPVYRGCAIPGLEGTYFFADLSSFVGSFRRQGTGITDFNDRTAQFATATNGGTLNGPTSFGEDALGEIYITDHSGGDLFKIVAGPGVNPATISLSGPPALGTTLNLNLASPIDGGRAYAFALSLSVWPPIVLPELRAVPLTPDWLLFASLDPQFPYLAGQLGSLDASGNGVVQLVIPNEPLLSGTRVFGGFVSAAPGAPSGISRISCPVTIAIP